MFDRLIGLIGNDKFDKLRCASVIVFGCGGVGGYVVESLVRSGIGTISIVDFDTVDISNINRQIIALNSNIGKYKVDLIEDRIKDINPSINVYKYNEKVTPENIEQLFVKDYDFVIDCVDDIKIKEEIIRICSNKNINFITCLGTGKRIDPSKIMITTLDKTSYDPIARRLRKYVKDNNIKVNVPVLFSTEEPINDNLSRNVIYSSCFVPSVAGIMIANYVFKKLIS